MFTQLGGLMAERVTDLRDVRDRVIAELSGLPEPGVPVPDVPSILCAEDLAPADTAGLDPALVVALATTLGGPTSHTAIIARQLGIPCVVAVGGPGRRCPAARPVMVDGTRGTVTVEPDPGGRGQAVEVGAPRGRPRRGWTGPRRHRATVTSSRCSPMSRTAPPRVGRARRPPRASGCSAPNCASSTAPTEPTVDEQAQIYAEVFDAFAGSKVVIRTLDAGSDKPLKFAGHPGRGQPGAGRARHPHRRRQPRHPRAAARRHRRPRPTAPALRPWVMAPMIATAAEARTSPHEYALAGLTPGVMIEVPAAALLADRILAHVDFLSIGTNDLTQYTMAADRMSADLADLTDPWQPAVLALVAMAAKAGAAADKPVGVCGEAAADPLLACVLVGLGVTSLSAAAAAVAGVGAKLATVTLAQCRAAADAALATASAADARAVAIAALS